MVGGDGFKLPPSIEQLLLLITRNPYNAFRLADTFLMLLFVLPRRGKITSEAINAAGITQILETPLFYADKSGTLQPSFEIDSKCTKAALYASILSKIVETNTLHAMLCLLDYPAINQSEGFTAVVQHDDELDSLNFAASLEFRPMESLKDFKVTALLKAQKER